MKTATKWVVVTICCSLTLFVFVPHAQAEEDAPATPASQIDAYLHRLTAIGGFSGSVLVAKDGEVLMSKGYGLADREKGTPNTPQTRYILASISKQFIATSILMLQEQHLLTTQDHVCLYVPDCPRAWRTITLHHLLTHTSGIPDYMAFRDFGARMDQPYSPTQLVGWFRNQALEFAPGTRWRYSNSGYALLGYVIEQVSSEPLAQFLHEAIFHPLHMDNSGFDPDNAISTNLAIGYDGDERSDYMDMSVAYAPGGLYASVDDLYRWSTALDTDTILPVNTINLLFKRYARIPGVNAGSYGYGWFIRKRSDRAVEEHTGMLAGFSTVITRFPAEHITIIVLCNQTVSINTVTNEISRLALISR